MLFIWIWLIWCMRDLCYSEEVWLIGCRRTFFCYLGLDQVVELGLWHLQGVHLLRKGLILLLSWMSGEIFPFPIFKMALNVLRRVLAQAVRTTPLTRWLKQQTFIYFSVLKVGKSKIKVCQEVRFLVQALFPACTQLQADSWLCPQVVVRNWAHLSSSSCEGANPIAGAPPSRSHPDLLTSRKPHFLLPSHPGLGLSHMN